MNKENFFEKISPRMVEEFIKSDVESQDCFTFYNTISIEKRLDINNSPVFAVKYTYSDLCYYYTEERFFGEFGELTLTNYPNRFMPSKTSFLNCVTPYKITDLNWIKFIAKKNKDVLVDGKTYTAHLQEKVNQQSKINNHSIEVCNKNNPIKLQKFIKKIDLAKSATDNFIDSLID